RLAEAQLPLCICGDFDRRQMAERRAERVQVGLYVAVGCGLGHRVEVKRICDVEAPAARALQRGHGRAAAERLAEVMDETADVCAGVADDFQRDVGRLPGEDLDALDAYGPRGRLHGLAAARAAVQR